MSPQSQQSPEVPLLQAKIFKPEAYYIENQPYYEAVGDEIAVFEAAYRNQLPVLLKGPTGCGKTRFMEHMAWRLQRPLITVSCHDGIPGSLAGNATRYRVSPAAATTPTNSR